MAKDRVKKGKKLQKPTKLGRTKTLRVPSAPSPIPIPFPN